MAPATQRLARLQGYEDSAATEPHITQREQNTDAITAVCEVLACAPLPALLYGLVPLLPKSGESAATAGPTKQRPVTVLPLFYRCYASIRYKHLLKWQAQWIHPSLRGGIPKGETAEISLEVALELELARLSKTNLVVTTLDESKCYDSVVRDIAFGAASDLGAPE